MALSDSMFLFEILIKDIKSYINCNQFKFTGQFADIFKLQLKSPAVTSLSKKLLTKSKVKEKYKVRKNNRSVCNRKFSSNIKKHIGQSVLIINKSSLLISLMKKYPLEINISRQNVSDPKIGSSVIPWGKEYINYLIKSKTSDLPPACTEGLYNVYDEITLKRIATITISLKLTYLSNRITSQFISISSNKPETFMYTRINSKPTFVLSTLKENSLYINIPGSLECHTAKDISNKTSIAPDLLKNNNLQKEHLGCIKSDSNINNTYHKTVFSVKSCPSFHYKPNKFLLRYIFGDPKGSFGHKVYHVGYFTIENDVSGQSSPKVTSNAQSSDQSTDGKKKLKFKKCDSECLSKGKATFSDSTCSLDLPEEATRLVTLTKCKQIKCEYKKYRELPSPVDDRILLDLTNLKTDCCLTEVKEKIEEIVGGVTANMTIGRDPCYCTCECTFGFIKKTTYCKTCGGYEIAGQDLGPKTTQKIPIPCPIYHKLVDKSRLKTWSTSGSESKKKGDEQKSMKTGSGQRATTPDKRSVVSEKKSVESEKDKKKKRDDRFKFNYGYKAPQIGHSKCALPCSGTLENVPKSMGWLWTAEDVLGMKFRPMWKPGATNKHVVRLLKNARNPGEMISKKKRKETGKKKRPLKRPLLVVHKKDGEYSVTMETMKAYSKQRALNQHPYEDKPVVTYTIGRTEEENRERLKKKERVQRRLERAQRHIIQSTFKNLCHEICLKTYQQALSLLPDAEDPECTCYPALPSAKTTNMNVSCSCSEDDVSIGSDTDSDEWIVEFTPPNAKFDPAYKGKKVFKADNGTQYTYLDFRVKLVDRFGNPVPRFFKGPDGKQQCSDLGGFWSPDRKWLEINIDGYVAPDGRWAPNNFIGPNGEQVDAETGKFQAMNGKWLVVGVDGFIDSQGKWKYYPKQTDSMKKRRRCANDGKKGKPGDKTVYRSEASWSCFGDASPKQLSKLGIVGHGEDRKLLIATLKDLLAHGEDVRIPQPSTVFHLTPSDYDKKEKKGGIRKKFHQNIQDKYKCQHPRPSDKGIIAVDDRGRKTYFRLRDHKNIRPKERMAMLAEQGISLSSFHVPCFHSFINSEVMKQQQSERVVALSSKNMATQVHQEWKPGAISKKLLQKLDKAKSRKSTEETAKRIKYVKKLNEDKPTLSVSKKNGQYHIKLQPARESTRRGHDQCTPLIYKIESSNNKAKLKKKERIQRRLVRAAVNEVWSNTFHPDMCDQICLKAYKQVFGMSMSGDHRIDEIENSNSCSSEDEEVSPSCTSSEVDWEIYFTPPFMSHHTTINEDVQ